MADLVIVPGNVIPQAGATLWNGISGEASITPGQPCYVDPDDNQVKLADANGAAAAAGAKVRGVACNEAQAIGQPIRLCTGGPLQLGVGVRGTVIVLSDTAGGLAPAADLAAGMFVTTLGVIDGSQNLLVKVDASGVQV